MKHLDAQLCVVAICKENLIITLNFMEKYVFSINSGLEVHFSSIFSQKEPDLFQRDVLNGQPVGCSGKWVYVCTL
jgi:hypothetical protein